MKFTNIIFLLPYFLASGKCDMKPYVVGGNFASINNFPYSAFLGVTCKANKKGVIARWICGSSILNQNIVLTAGHCLFSCSAYSSIVVSVGSASMKGTVTSVSAFIIHFDFNEFYTGLSADIAMARVKTPFKLNSKSSRVALMSQPPYKEEAKIAGWGLVDESAEIETNKLKYTRQYVLDRKKCLRVFKSMPNGTLCAQSKHGDSYASSGDSGSALVVRGYIQIGLVSYKIPAASRSVVVYTDVGYFYTWIKKQSTKIMCQ